jgi:predicted 3-demethylubiquinone-9 3-methyltransferase (glyoxalase superfamily)
MQKITPFLWFDNNAEEAVNFYVSIFKNSKIIQVKRYPEGMDDPHVKDMGGKVLTAVFELDGEQFMAMDAGPIFKSPSKLVAYSMAPWAVVSIFKTPRIAIGFTGLVFRFFNVFKSTSLFLP